MKRKKLAIRKGKVVLVPHKKASQSSKTGHFQLKCLKCEYTWDTKYPKIPAKCPSCNSKIYGSANYEIIKEYQESSNCFIATAAYSTPLAEEINILRYWRDKYLVKNLMGRIFIKIYYITSPPIARYISDKGILKAKIRNILNNLIELLKNKFI